MKMAAPMGNIEIDTDSDADIANPIGKQIASSLKQLTQAKITFSMDPRGEVSNVQVASSTPGGGAALGQMFGKDGMVSMVKQSILPLPPKPVQKGDSWENKAEMEVPTLGKVSADSKLTYDGPMNADGKTLEQIKVETKTNIAQKQGANALAQISIKEQSDSGTMYFDNSAGRFSHADTVQNLVLNVAVAGQNVDQTIKTVRKAVLTPVTK
jgi:hypothetical protein